MEAVWAVLGQIWVKFGEEHVHLPSVVDVHVKKMAMTGAFELVLGEEPRPPSSAHHSPPTTLFKAPLKGYIKPLKGYIKPLKGYIRPLKGLYKAFKGVI